MLIQPTKISTINLISITLSVMGTLISPLWCMDKQLLTEPDQSYNTMEPSDARREIIRKYGEFDPWTCHTHNTYIHRPHDCCKRSFSLLSGINLIGFTVMSVIPPCTGSFSTVMLEAALVTGCVGAVQVALGYCEASLKIYVTEDGIKHKCHSIKWEDIRLGGDEETVIISDKNGTLNWEFYKDEWSVTPQELRRIVELFQQPIPKPKQME